MFRSNAKMSFLGVIIADTDISLNSKTLFIISFSSSSIAPFSSPASTIIRISSSVTISSSLSVTPNSFDTAFVVNVSIFTNGARMMEIARIIPTVANAIFSWFFIPILFGTNSPKIRVKKDNSIVTNIIAMFFAELPSNGVSSGAKSSANDSAAKALDKNPASVTPI